MCSRAGGCDNKMWKRSFPARRWRDAGLVVLWIHDVLDAGAARANVRYRSAAWNDVVLQADPSGDSGLPAWAS